MDEQKFAELKAQIAAYKATPRASDAPAALDWGILFTILPMILSLFVKDPALRDIITKVVEMLKGLFSGSDA